MNTWHVYACSTYVVIVAQQNIENSVLYIRCIWFKRVYRLLETCHPSCGLSPWPCAYYKTMGERFSRAQIIFGIWIEISSRYICIVQLLYIYIMFNTFPGIVDKIPNFTWPLQIYGHQSCKLHLPVGFSEKKYTLVVDIAMEHGPSIDFLNINNGDVPIHNS